MESANYIRNSRCSKKEQARAVGKNSSNNKTILVPSTSQGSACEETSNITPEKVERSRDKLYFPKFQFLRPTLDLTSCKKPSKRIVFRFMLPLV